MTPAEKYVIDNDLKSKETMDGIEFINHLETFAEQENKELRGDVKHLNMLTESFYKLLPRFLNLMKRKMHINMYCSNSEFIERFKRFNDLSK